MGAYRDRVLADEPSALWLLDTTADAAPGSVADMLTFVGSPPLADRLVPTEANQSRDFDGSTQYATAVDSADLDLGDVFTLEAWIRLDTLPVGDIYAIVSKGVGAYTLRVASDSGKLALASDGVAEIVESTVALSIATVYHVVATKNGATVKLYIDGEDRTGTVTNSTLGDTAGDVTIGRRTGVPPRFFNGRIGWVALYPVALSPAAIRAHYNAGTFSQLGTPPPTFQAVVTDLAGRTRALLTDYQTIRVTPRINSHAELRIDLDPLADQVTDALIAEHAIRLYDDTILIFNGQIWEPRQRGARRAQLVARDPYAALAARRAQAEAQYTATNNGGGPWDAGEIVHDRLAIQNVRAQTLLKAGTRQASVNRLRTVNPGTLEGETVAELADTADGFFFRVTPVDDDETALGQLDILYPDAGSTRPDVIFGYGEHTVANLDDYDLSDTLPRNRMVAASSAAGGGRIAKSAKDQASIDQYGLFEDETTFSDVTDDALLVQHAEAEIRPTPPLTITLTPGPESPLVYRDFNVGDFVRVHIDHGSVSLLTWVRVLDATLAIDVNGIATLEGLSVEVISGSNLAAPPHRVFRARLDDERRRLEALERRVQRLVAADTAAPAEPVDDDAPPPAPPAEPPPTEGPPPAPQRAPTVAMSSANGYWIFGSSPAARVSGSVNPNGLATVAWFEIEAGASTPEQGVGAGTDPVGVSADVSPLASGTTYRVRIRARNSAGTSTSDWMQFTTPTVPAA